MSIASSRDPAKVSFDFVRKSGPDGEYINGVHIRFQDDGKVVEEWSSSSGTDKVTLFLNSRAK